MGSPVVRIRKKTSVTRMKIVGKIRRKRTRRYRPNPPPPVDLGFGRPGSGAPSTAETVLRVLMDSSGVQGNGGDPR
jgi:hypothetical protein